MFEDPRSRRVWRLFHLRAELMLGGVSGDIRRQLLEDLAAHVRDAVDHQSKDIPETDRLNAALVRIGDPREFIAPLLTDAILDAKRSRFRAGAGWRALLHYAHRGGVYLVRSASIILMLAAGAALVAVAIGGVLRPDAVGVFRLGADEVQLRLFGLTQGAGEPVLYPWLVLALGVIGGALVWLGWRRLRRILGEIMMSA